MAIIISFDLRQLQIDADIHKTPIAAPVCVAEFDCPQLAPCWRKSPCISPRRRQGGIYWHVCRACITVAYFEECFRVEHHLKAAYNTVFGAWGLPLVACIFPVHCTHISGPGALFMFCPSREMRVVHDKLVGAMLEFSGKPTYCKLIICVFALSPPLPRRTTTRLILLWGG